MRRSERQDGGAKSKSKKLFHGLLQVVTVVISGGGRLAFDVINEESFEVAKRVGEQSNIFVGNTELIGCCEWSR